MSAEFLGSTEDMSENEIRRRVAELRKRLSSGEDLGYKDDLERELVQLEGLLAQMSDLRESGKLRNIH